MSDRPLRFAPLAVLTLGLALSPLFAPATPAAPAPDTPSTAPPTIPKVVAAYGTSYGQGSRDALCLLDPACKGFWTPESSALGDGGVNEGIAVQFAEPTFLTYIQIEAEGAPSTQLRVYLDGKSGGAADTFEPGRADEKIGEKAGEDGDAVRQNFSRRLWTERYRYDNGVNFYLVSGDSGALDYTAKSVFIKIDHVPEGFPPPRIRSIRFYGVPEFDESDPGEPPLALALPLAVPAVAKATSTLEPKFAYDVSHLFDSQFDMAWSTDGKGDGTEGGKGVEISVAFESEQTVAAVMIWNGYQRSDVHYRANGRVRTLEVFGNTGNQPGKPQILAVKDEQGPQIVPLKQSVTAREIVLRVTGIYPGGSYRDLLISELRFLTPEGRILLPVVPPSRPEGNTLTARVADRAFAAFIHSAGPSPRAPDEWQYDVEAALQGNLGYDACHDSSFRLRSNGSFVIYSDTSAQGDIYEGTYFEDMGVMEGNWEPQGAGPPGMADGAIRLFGKRYRVPLQEILGTGYLQDAETLAKLLPEPKIFQSPVKLAFYSDLPEAERLNLLNFLVESRYFRYGEEEEGAPASFVIQAAIKPEPGRVFDSEPQILSPDAEWKEGDPPPYYGDSDEAGGDDYAMTLVFGKSRAEAVKNLDAFLLPLNPLTVRSDVYTDVLLPAGRVGLCNAW